MLLLVAACRPDDPNRPPASEVPTGFAEGAVVLNELKVDGIPSDWVELYNTTDEPQDLTGAVMWNLDRDPQDPWSFPEGTVIGPGEYLTIDCDEGSTTTDELHASFRLGAEGGQLFLSHPTADGVALQNVSYPDHGLSDSWARFDDWWGPVPNSTRGNPNGGLARTTARGTVYRDNHVEPELIMECDPPASFLPGLAFAEFEGIPADGWVSVLLDLEPPCPTLVVRDRVDGEISVDDQYRPMTAAYDSMESALGFGCTYPVPEPIAGGEVLLQPLLLCSPGMDPVVFDMVVVYGPLDEVD